MMHEGYHSANRIGHVPPDAAGDASFLKAIYEAPDEDAPRLRYANWLDQRGDPRGEFIHVQFGLAILPDLAADRQDLHAREQKLLEEHRSTWEYRLRALHVTAVTFHRGFPETVSMTEDNFLANAEELFQRAPTVRGIHVRLSNPDDVAILAASPHLSRLTTLELPWNGIGPATARRLAASPHIARLTRLNLGFNHIGHAGARALATCPRLANLKALDLGLNQIGDAGAQALAASPHLKNLTTLNLCDNGIGNAGAEALARSPHLGCLVRLQLNNNQVNTPAVEALIRSPLLPKLTSLDLAGNHVVPTALAGIDRVLATRRDPAAN